MNGQNRAITESDGGNDKWRSRKQ